MKRLGTEVLHEATGVLAKGLEAFRRKIPGIMTEAAIEKKDPRQKLMDTLLRALTAAILVSNESRYMLGAKPFLEGLILDADFDFCHIGDLDEQYNESDDDFIYIITFHALDDEVFPEAIYPWFTFQTMTSFRIVGAYRTDGGRSHTHMKAAPPFYIAANILERYILEICSEATAAKLIAGTEAGTDTELSV